MKKIFSIIEEKENYIFKKNIMYTPKTKFEIETPDGYHIVKGMIVKEDILYRIKTNNYTIKMGSLHKLKKDNEVYTYVKDLNIGDILKNENGNEKIIEIEELEKNLVFDINVGSEESEYFDEYGFYNHNTWHITEGPRSLEALLGHEGGEWTYHSGMKAAPLAFYKALFQERDKIIVFDEADSILKNDDIIMMLKPVLDTSGKNYAEYGAHTKNMVGKTEAEIEEYCNYVDEEIASGTSIGTGKNDVMLPSKFPFKGGIVFISNMRAKEIEKAIMSRSIFIDVYLAERDLQKRIKTIGYAKAAKDSGLDKIDVDDVLDALGESIGQETTVTYMTPEYARKNKQITVRALELGLKFKKAGLSRWKELTALYA